MNDSADHIMIDNRRRARKKTFLTAYATLAGGRGPIPCLVRELSQTGARIVLADPQRLSAIFDLHINGRDRVLRVETVWRNATEAGLRLLAKVPFTEAPPVRAAAVHAGALRSVIHVDAPEMRP